MKKKIISFGIVTILLLVGGMSFSTAAKQLDESIEPVEPEEPCEPNNPVGDDFDIRIRRVGIGVSIYVTSLSGESRIGYYNVVFDYRIDWKGEEYNGDFTCKPDVPGDLTFSSHQFGFGQVSVSVSIGSQSESRNGFCFGLSGFTVLFK